MAEDYEEIRVPWQNEPLRFPSGMSDEDKRSAIERNFPQQIQAARNAGTATAAAGSGGFVRGIPLVGDYLDTAAKAAAAGIRSTMYGTPYEAERKAVEDYSRAAAEQHPYVEGAGQVAGGVTALAPVGATAYGAKALGLTGGLTSRVLWGGGSSAALSAADAYLRGQDPTAAALASGAVGAAAAPVTSAIARGISPLYSQLTRNVERGAVANKLRQFGVDVSAGEESGSPTIRWMESSLGGLTDDQRAVQQAKQFTTAALREAGIAGDSLDPNTLNKAFTDIGKRYDDAATKTAIYGGGLSPAGTTGQGNLVMLGNELQQIVGDYKTLAQVQPGVVTAPENFLARIIDAAVNGGGIIRGDAYQTIASDLARLARKTADPAQKMALLDMRSALNDAMERGAAGTPYEKIWSQLNRQYRNLLTLEKAAGSSAELTALHGTISPARLTQAIGGRAYARDRSDLADLARAGNALLKPLPQSGTAPRTFFMQTVPGALAAGAGGVYGGVSQGDWSGAAYGGLAGVGATYGMGKLINQPWFQQYLRNRILQQAPQIPSYAAPLAGALQ